LALVVPAPLDVQGARGRRWARALELPFLWLDRLLSHAIPPHLNPFLHTGAVANVALTVAVVSGAVLLIWYVPSVHHAHESVAAMGRAPWTAGLVRTLHRVSSDLLVFFTTVHAVRLFAEQRFVGARWLAWITGLFLVATLWFVGWLGYWLVWDGRGQLVAEGSARVVDALPILIDPVGRSLLANTTISSLLFFVVFFVHMLVPMVSGVLLWLHLARLARPDYWPNRSLVLWTVGLMVVVSVVWPADLAAPADMATVPGAMPIDAWYLIPLALTDRLGGGALWALMWVGTALIVSLPWTLARTQAQPARVEQGNCNACEQCYTDCPFDAIAMVPRTDGSLKFELAALVNPAQCVACGICAGSCDSLGVGLPTFDAASQRDRVRDWVKQDVLEGRPPFVMLGCASSGASGLQIDADGRCAELPGWRTLSVPCAGWVHMRMIERAISAGAQGVLISACAEGACRFREGELWAEQRVEGTRSPALRHSKVRRDQVLVARHDRTATAGLLGAADAFAQGSKHGQSQGVSPTLQGLGLALLALAVGAVTVAGASVPYAAPSRAAGELVVTFKHPGAPGGCREPSAEELAGRAAHMRPSQICDTARSPVGLMVHIDGVQVHRASYAPTGLWSDGLSVGEQHLTVAPGEHTVTVSLGDSESPDEFRHVVARTLDFRAGRRVVVGFNREVGFHWHGEQAP
jgi:coenzyme F420-reducing hydrogenase delta subunit/NAD-dependent dihydropyrimidine dehydrogenase PreA subunit